MPAKKKKKATDMSSAKPTFINPEEELFFEVCKLQASHLMEPIVHVD